jgi:hypothetical protein
VLNCFAPLACCCSSVHHVQSSHGSCASPHDAFLPGCACNCNSAAGLLLVLLLHSAAAAAGSAAVLCLRTSQMLPRAQHWLPSLTGLSAGQIKINTVHNRSTEHNQTGQLCAVCQGYKSKQGSSGTEAQRLHSHARNALVNWPTAAAAGVGELFVQELCKCVAAQCGLQKPLAATAYRKGR